MHLNYEFILSFAAGYAGKILDYGCGRGEVVSEGLRRGLDVWGVDVFYGGAPTSRATVESTGLLHTRIRPIQHGRIPFADNTFDLVFHNQVFEHVPDMESALKEIARVLRPSGLMLSLFPSREVWREGHCGIVLAHRLKSATWLWLWRSLGFGSHHGSKRAHEWAWDFKQWLNDWCFYRDEAAIRKAYEAAGFNFNHHEIDYIIYRLNFIGKGNLVSLARACRPIAQYLFKKLSGMVLLSDKTELTPRPVGLIHRREHAAVFDGGRE